MRDGVDFGRVCEGKLISFIAFRLGLLVIFGNFKGFRSLLYLGTFTNLMLFQILKKIYVLKYIDFLKSLQGSFLLVSFMLFTRLKNFNSFLG